VNYNIMRKEEDYRTAYTEWRRKLGLDEFPSFFQIHHIKPRCECLLAGWSLERINHPRNLIHLHPDDHKTIHLLRGDTRSKSSGFFLMASSKRMWNDKEWSDNHSKKTSEGTKRGIAEKDTTEARSERAKDIWKRPGYKEYRSEDAVGQNNNNSKLTENDVKDIRHYWDNNKHRITGKGKGCAKQGKFSKYALCREIAKLYNVTPQPLLKIIEGKSWKNI